MAHTEVFILCTGITKATRQHSCTSTEAGHTKTINNTVNVTDNIRNSPPHPQYSLYNIEKKKDALDEWVFRIVHAGNDELGLSAPVYDLIHVLALAIEV